MSSALEIDGKTFYPIKTVASKVSYSRDYITRLAREGKIHATNVGRQWFVDLESLNSYCESSSIEADLRKKRLSEERKIEQQAILEAKRKKAHRETKAKFFDVRATAVASVVLTLGLVGGWVTYNVINFDQVSQTFATNIFGVSESQVGLVPASEKVKLSSNLTAPSDNTQSAPQPIEVVRPISKDVANGILLLPHGTSSASATEMFSDEVKVITADDGTQMIVRLDEYGNPTGNIIPFVTVPVNNSDR